MYTSKIANCLRQLQDELSNCEEKLNELVKVKKIMSEKSIETIKINNKLQRTPVAIIGMASIFPQSRNLQEYWKKITCKVDCITDVPPSRWDIDAYYDPDPKAPDKTYCKRGGFIPDIDFNPMEFGLPPNILEVTDISQLLSLVIAKEAMEDAGYGESRQFNRERTGVILGVALARQLTMPLAARLQYPVWEKVLKSSGLSDEDTQEIIEKIKSSYVQWDENAFPGMLANVVTGRIANRLDLGGMNCVVDAACASSLGALALALSEIIDHKSDMMITGGVDTDNSIVAYMCFSKTPAVSRSQNAKPFDADSDGMMLGEGIGMMVLKRLKDAERDNDKIYAVIKGIGTSSDGRYKSIYAPRLEGQIRALRRAYEDAGCSPASVGLIEAHGTGTMAGDPTEFAALKEFFSENNPKKQHIALGSVKSQIGHTKAAAGAASLIKTALALYHKVLPPTINVTKPNPKLDIEASPFYLNTETRPWMRTAGEPPRLAGVSSFGFGGTNYHVVLEEYESENDCAYPTHNAPQSVLLFAPTPEQLLTQCQDMLGNLLSTAGERHYAELVEACESLEISITDARIGFVTDSLTEACKLLQTSIDWLKNKTQAESWEHPQGIYYRKIGIAPERKVVALFSGQGSQYTEMGKELVINFPCLRQAYSYVDSLLSKDGLQPISEIVFPPPVFNIAQRQAQAEALQPTQYAQPAIGVFSVGLYKILQQAGFKPDFVAGHSFGELTALWAAEVLSDEDYFFLAKARGQAMAAPNEPNFDAGAMLAVKGDVGKVEEIVKNFPRITIANFNSNHQVVLAGEKLEIAKVQQTLIEGGYSVVLLPVSAAFHTPLVSHAQKPFAQAIESVTFKNAKIPVYTNVTGKLYPNQPQAIKKILKEHLINLVLFKQEIENIYGSGGSFFVEFGPKNILSNLVKDILGDRPHLAVALNANRQKNSDRQLREAVVQLRVAGLPLKNLDPNQLKRQTSEPQKNNVLNVRLNSSNYVSEKTKMALEKALQNKHQVQAPADKSEVVPVTQSILSSLNDIAHTGAKSAPVLNGNGNHPSHEKEDLLLHSSKRNAESTSEPKKQLSSERPLNYERVLDSLEYTLAQFNRHQGDALRVHEQSLEHHTEYHKTFYQLTQQTNLLFPNGKSTAQKVETKPVVLESSERSMMRFHDHQAETLRVHEQYLNQQTAHSNSFFQFIQQQYEQLIAGDFTERISAPVVSDRDSPVATPKEQDKPVVLTTTAKVVQPDLVTTHYASSKGLKPVLAAEVEPEVTATVSPPLIAIDLADLSQILLTIVSEKTGYPAEMLELNMDMEADLGIDSIKRVEILGTLLEMFPDLPKPDMEELAELRTLGQIAEYMQQQGDSAEKILQDRPYSQQPELNHNIVRSMVRLKMLPEPDFLEFSLPDRHIALLTDDGSIVTSRLAQSLTERGWKVVVLSFPQSLTAERSPLLEGINRVVLESLSEEHLQQQLAAIATNYGNIAAFIHLNPIHQDEQSQNILYPEIEAALIKQVFLIAKHLKEPLHKAQHQGRSCFLTVAHLDGKFGLGQQINFGAISGGLFGLTKTLNQEWESVFCRAVDLHPDLDVERSLEYIIAELHDPNRLITEVGYSSQGRATLVCEKYTSCKDK
jgi:polyketide-type polyunsaturated fatty acid synthase PfaA